MTDFHDRSQVFLATMAGSPLFQRPVRTIAAGIVIGNLALLGLLSVLGFMAAFVPGLVQAIRRSLDGSP